MYYVSITFENRYRINQITETFIIGGFLFSLHLYTLVESLIDKF